MTRKSPNNAQLLCFVFTCIEVIENILKETFALKLKWVIWV